jgi:protein phosphatase
VTGFDNIEYASLTDVGVRRSHNQDDHVILTAGDLEHWREQGHIFLVADGMGAHAVGELASKLAVGSIPHIYSKYAHEGPVAALRKAFVEANQNIHTRGQQNREFEGMGTTATALLLRPEGVWVGHVGDSRAYRVRNGQIEQLSFDHSLVWELARRQHVEPEELQGIPPNVIVRSLGPEAQVQVDVEGPHPIREGDIFILCSDGLSGPLSNREIGAAASALPPKEACRFLVDLANLQGGPDNITVLVVRVGGTGSSDAADAPDKIREPLPWYEQIPWPLSFLILGVLLAIGAAILTWFKQWGLDVLLFVAAALALITGLVGLMITHQQEKRRLKEEPEAPRLKVYRQTGCAIERPLVERMAKAVTVLEQRIREKEWEADWEACHQHLAQGRQHEQRGDLIAAFREYCRAMRPLTEAVQRQRNKEEAFRPLWDNKNTD